MTGFASQPNRFIPGRFVSWARIVAIVLMTVALLALSFALGRMTMDRAGSSTTILRSVVVQPASSPAVGASLMCRVHEPC